jgi:hypothetical protein
LSPVASGQPAGLQLALLDPHCTRYCRPEWPLDVM